MPRIAYVNGRYLRHDQAAVHIEDRGFQFADSVYEVIALIDGRLADEEAHLQRLDRSLAEIRMDWPVRPPVLRQILRRMVVRNRLRNGLIYLQISRGMAQRDFRFPIAVPPTLVITARRAQFMTQQQAVQGVSVISIPDIRWGRCDIKSTGLLASVLGKQQAAEAGAFEAWQVDAAGYVTEGCSSNAWIVDAAGTLITRPADHAILDGITRRTLLRLAADRRLAVQLRPFTVAEAITAREAFLSSAGTFCLSVVRIDGRPVGTGHAGPVALGLRRAYLDHVGISS